MTSYTKIIDNDLASGALYDKVNDMADALNAGKLEKTSFGLRKASTAYTSGVVVACEYHSDLLLKCTTAGTTGVGALDTSGALVSGNTISDGTVVWTAVTNGTVRSVNGVLPDNSGDTHITIESGWTLLDHKWADHILNDIRWLRADTFSWQDGSVYASAYSALVNDITGVNSTTETVGSYTITYYPGNSGRKIVLATMESTVANIYAESGVAWYYILDTTNQRFKLPRENPNREELIEVIRAKGTGRTLGFTNGSVNVGMANDSGGNSRLFATEANYDKNVSISSYGGYAPNGAYGITLDSTKSGIISDMTDSTSVYKGKKHLYFYVGNYTQSAVEQTAGLSSELFNGKVDIDLENVSQDGKESAIFWSMPDYSSGVILTKTANYENVINKKGYVLFNADYTYGNDVAYLKYSATGTPYQMAACHTYNNNYYDGSHNIVPVDVGNVVYNTAGLIDMTFFPCKGC